MPNKRYHKDHNKLKGKTTGTTSNQEIINKEDQTDIFRSSSKDLQTKQEDIGRQGRILKIKAINVKILGKGC